MKPATPITDKHAFNVCPWHGHHVSSPKGACIDSRTARRLELDRAALMQALGYLLDECDYQAMCGTFNETRIELANAKSALAAARASFPIP